MGSSSDMNFDARKSVPAAMSQYNPRNKTETNLDIPVDGLSPNCTICRSETPVAGNEA